MLRGKKSVLGVLGTAAVLLCLTGCGTLGSDDQVSSMIYDSHRRIVNLDQSLDGSIKKLNETSAELSARVDASDQQIRTLQSTVEENQVKLDKMQRTIENLSATLYRWLNLSPPTSGSTVSSTPSEVEADPVRVSPPPASALPQPATLSPAPSTTAPAAVPSDSEEIPMPPETVSVAGDPEMDYQVAQRSYANEDYETALQQFGAFVQRYPGNDLCANAQFWKGYCCFNLGRHQEAITEFETLRTSYADSSKLPFAMHIQAMAHKQLGQRDQAIALLQNVVQNYPMTAAADRSKTELENLLQGN